MADSPTPNEQVSQAIEDSSSKAKENLSGRVSGLEEVIKRSTIEESEAQNYININKQLEEFLNKTRLSKADISDINALLGAQYAQSNDITKSMLGREPLNARNKRDLKAIIGLSQTILETNKNIVKMSKDTISNKSKEIAYLKEQIKLESQSQKAKEKADAAREKYEEKLRSSKYSYKPTSELLKLAMDRGNAVSEYRATHNGNNPANYSETGQKALMAAGYGMEGFVGASRGAISIAQGGLSGLGGAAGGVATMLGEISKVGGLALGTAVGGPIGAAIGASLGSLVGPVLQAGVQAQLLILERGIRGNIFNASLNKMNNFSNGLISPNRVGVNRKDMSYDEVESIRDSAFSIGADLSDGNKNNVKHFEYLAAAKKLYGEDGVKVIRELTFATNNYEAALSGVNSVMASSIEGSKNLNISQNAVAGAMANAGKQARFAGTDAMSAMSLYHSIISNKDQIESMKGAGIDFSSEGGSLVGGLASIGSRLNLASQVYMAANQGETDPLKAMFKMQYGDIDASMKDGRVIFGAPKKGGEFFGAKAIHADLMEKLNEFTDSNGGDVGKGMSMLQMYAQQAHPGLTKKDVDFITSINPDNKEELKKVSEAIDRPKTVLAQLQTMQSINQNVSNTMAGYLSHIPGIESLVQKLAGISSGGNNYLSGNDSDRLKKRIEYNKATGIPEIDANMKKYNEAKAKYGAWSTKTTGAFAAYRESAHKHNKLLPFEAPTPSEKKKEYEDADITGAERIYNWAKGFFKKTSSGDYKVPAEVTLSRALITDAIKSMG